MDQPLAASRRVKENRFYGRRVELGPPGPPPESVTQRAERILAERDLEEEAEIRTFLNQEGPVADGVRRVVLAVRRLRRERESEWDAREAAASFVRNYRHAVPHADKEYLRGMEMALKVYLGTQEAL